MRQPYKTRKHQLDARIRRCLADVRAFLPSKTMPVEASRAIGAAMRDAAFIGQCAIQDATGVRCDFGEAMESGE